MITYRSDTALVVVDCQNDFADPDGSLYVEGGEVVVATANAEVVRALAAGASVFYTQDWHPEETPHFETGGGPWPVHCVGGTWGADFHPRLLVAGPGVKKGRHGEDGYSGFTMRDPETGNESPTELESLVREAGASSIVVVGLAFDHCVRATALDAAELGFGTTVVRDATAAVELEEGDAERTASDLRGAGVQLA